MAWKATLARVVFGGRARRALDAARADLAERPLPESVARRAATPLGRRRILVLRGVASALAARLASEGETHPCLVSSLALLGEARRCGFAPSLVIGVRKGSDGAASHAWLTLDGRPFLEADHVAEAYAPIAVLPEPPS